LDILSLVTFLTPKFFVVFIQKGAVCFQTAPFSQDIYLFYEIESHKEK